jgi:hypothetical protein
MTVRRVLLAIVLLAAVAGCGGTGDDDGDGDGPTARRIAEEACAALEEIAEIDPADTEAIQEVIDGLAGVDAAQEAAGIDIEEVDAEMQDICPDVNG